ncbi:hypothetical protein pipiens_011285 [Culex pipiens pipiens]|uniref:G-protein coupled receptors family 1 profile domain-containing protein n=1 Tax=Culex pipiens pipiens TaxID=38569 RepID=A0ABD1D705_CULPP
MDVTAIGQGGMTNDTDVTSGGGGLIGDNGTMTTTTTTNHESVYCGQGLDDFHTSYSNIHGIVCLLVCIFGSIANTLNIVVLTRREMRSPTNAILTEFPQGILGLLSAVLGPPFFYNCYLKLGDLMDVMALINSAINFILYCTMSRQFRSTFNYLFRPKFLDKWLPVSQHEDDGESPAGRRIQEGGTTQITQV